MNLINRFGRSSVGVASADHSVCSVHYVCTYDMLWEWSMLARDAREARTLAIVFSASDCFATTVDIWHARISNAQFYNLFFPLSPLNLYIDKSSSCWCCYFCRLGWVWCDAMQCILIVCCHRTHSVHSSGIGIPASKLWMDRWKSECRETESMNHNVIINCNLCVCFDCSCVHTA